MALPFCVHGKDLCTTSTENREELESRNKLLHMLDSVTDALVWTIAKRGLTFQQQSTRLAHLLMLLAHIRHVRYSGRLHCSKAPHGLTFHLPSNKGMEHLSNMKRKNMVPLYDLLLEMLDANTMHSSRMYATYSQPPPGPQASESQLEQQPSHSGPSSILD
ncbi:hypothetical protein JZ751_002954 [Albula glossodonta]|uniref:Estrogen receptor beta n=1 Tax=Albula glossodonta TaxID=121402 RepID=A0A8T2NJK5_9TELE|nr:hypothetical protein JZ751_002954 [Albula glossodonta]